MNDEAVKKEMEGLPGAELSEPEEEPEEFSGDELSEPEEEPERFSGDELSEPDEDDESASLSEEGSEEIEKSGKKKRHPALWIAMAIAVVLLIAGGYFAVIGEKEAETELESSVVERFTIQKDHHLTFSSFLIPLIEGKGFTYISLSLSFDVPNSKLRTEMIGNEERLRGVIFDGLREAVNSANQVPPLGTLKALIIREVNSQLVSGQISEIYVIEFKAV